MSDKKLLGWWKVVALKLSETISEGEMASLGDELVKNIKGYSEEQNIQIQSKLDKAVEALNGINNTAPPMYKYGEIEMRMVLQAREALKEIK